MGSDITIVILFTQKLKIESLNALKGRFSQDDKIVCLTTHDPFKYEVEQIESILGNCIYLSFADLLSDEEMEMIDTNAHTATTRDVVEYCDNMKTMKNALVYEKLTQRFGKVRGYLFTYNNDLGVKDSVWINGGFKRVKGHHWDEKNENRKTLGNIKRIIKKIPFTVRVYHSLKPIKKVVDEIYLSHYNGKKVIFIGKIVRIQYRINLKFEKSYEERQKLLKKEYYTPDEAIYITSIHERHKARIIPNNLYIIQDGYFPPNSTDRNVFFDHANFFTWDKLGTEYFLKMGLPVQIMPFRKKLYLPTLNVKKVKKVVVATSSATDDSATKTHSDDDRLVKMFAEAAKALPGVEFVYRAHPGWAWIKGASSFIRINDFFISEGLSNIHLSSNIPNAYENGKVILSFNRSSLEEDVSSADLVFGENSAAMLDAGFKGIPFATVNSTSRRSFGEGLTNLGFPHCASSSDIISLINSFDSVEMREKYEQAVLNYNKMTDIEEI